MSSAGVAGGPAAPGAGESHARAARGAWMGSPGGALRLSPGSVAAPRSVRSGPAGPGRSNFDLLTEAIAQPRLEGQPPPPLLPLLLELQCSHSQLVLSPYLLLELAGHRYELVTFPPNPDMWGLGNERTPRDRGIWKRHPVAQSGKALAPGRAGELSWRLFCPGTV